MIVDDAVALLRSAEALACQLGAASTELLSALGGLLSASTLASIVAGHERGGCSLVQLAELLLPEQRAQLAPARPQMATTAVQPEPLGLNDAFDIIEGSGKDAELLMGLDRIARRLLGAPFVLSCSGSQI